MSKDQDWLNGLLNGYSSVQKAGVALPKRASVNLLGTGVSSISDNPTNNSTDVVLNGGSGGSTALLTLAFTQPLVWTAAVPTTGTMTVSDVSLFTNGKGVELQGGGFYLCSGVSGSSGPGTITVINQGGAVNAAPGTVIALGSIVTAGGAGLPVAAKGQLQGQALVNLGGSLAPIHGTVPLYFTDLATKLPDNPRQSITVDAYSATRPLGGGHFRWDVSYPNAASGTVSVTNGSTAITFASAQTFPAGMPFVFASDPTHQYFLSAGILNVTAAVLTTNYIGATNAATTATYSRPDDLGTKVTPTGYAGLGAWCRTGCDDEIDVLMFGGLGDCTFDNLAILQGMADTNYAGGHRRKLRVSGTTQKQQTLDNQALTHYAISSPLVIGDYVSSNGNYCHEIIGSSETTVALCPTNTGGALPYNRPTWLGPLVVIGDGGHNSTYGSDPYGADAMQAMTMGDSFARANGSPPFLNFTQYYFGDLTLPGTGNSWEVETFYNPGATSPGAGLQLAIGGIYGNLGTGTGTSYYSMQLYRNNAGAGAYIVATVTTSAGTYTISSATANAGAPLDVNLNVQNAIALAFDSRGLAGDRLYMFLNGTSGTGMNVAITPGAKILAKWYSQFVIGSGPSTAWPMQLGPTVPTGATIKIGKTHITKGITRHVANYTPHPASMVADGNTACLLDFASAPPRKSLYNWRIAYTGMAASGSGITPIPVYFDTSTTLTGYTSNARVSKIALSHPHGGQCINTISALNTSLADLKCTGHRAIEFNYYSYNSTIEKNVSFVYCGYGIAQGTPACFDSWNILFGDGSQIMKCGPNVSNNAGGNSTAWHMVSTFTNVEVEACYLGNSNIGSFAFVGLTGTSYLHNVTVDDENGQQALCHILAIGGRSLTIDGGYTSAFNGVPTLKVSGGVFVTSSMLSYVSPMVSFYADQNNGIPVVYRTSTGNVLGPVVYMDPANPGPVSVAHQELGTKTITIPGAAANYTMAASTANDQLWGNITINPTVALSAAITFRQANFNLNHITWVRNSDPGFAINFGGPSGGTVSIPASSSVRVRDTGTAMVAA